MDYVRLKDNKIFLSLFKRGRYICDKSCVVYYRKNGLSYNRVGFSTGKKVGSAVTRNRCRRIMRQAYHENAEFIPTGFDMIFVARVFTGECKSDVITAFVKKRVVPELKNGGKSVNKGGNLKKSANKNDKANNENNSLQK